MSLTFLTALERNYSYSMQRGMNFPMRKLSSPLKGQAPPPSLKNENILTSLSSLVKINIFWPPHNFSNSSDLHFLSISMSLCKFLQILATK